MKCKFCIEFCVLSFSLSHHSAVTLYVIMSMIVSLMMSCIMLKIFRAWDWFLVILVLYTAWASPFEFGFLQTPRAPLSIIDNVVNGFFAVDIVLTFFVAFLDKATYLLVDDPKRIAWRYTSTWLIFDVVSTVPYELFASLLHKTIQGYGIFSMLRLWRLRRVSKCFAR